MGKLRELLFIFARFFGTYGMMLFLYQTYLEKYKPLAFNVDPFSVLVSKQISFILNLIGIENTLVYFKKLHGIAIYIKQINTYPAYINEGCNAISVMIIFVAFLLTFYANFIKTSLYIFFGLCFIHLTNLFRIVLLDIIFLYFPAYAKFSHDIIFPIIIYGAVVLLWIGWIFYTQPINLKSSEQAH